MTDCLSQNLQLISEINKNVADKIEQTKILTSNFSFVYTQTGEVILVKDGCVLNNTSEPINEAIKIFESIPVNSENDTYILMGFELGYLLSYFANKYNGSIVVWEPCLETLSLSMGIIDYSKALSRGNVFITTNFDELNEAIAKVFTRKGKIHVVANEHYSNKHKDLIKDLSKQLNELCPEPYQGGPLKLNIGAGTWASRGWRTLDCYREADFYADLREMKRFEIEDNCIEKAFSSHCIEHISDKHVEHLFSELHRCMVPGGILRLGCPDADKALKAYKENNTEWFNWVKQSHIGEMLLNTFVSYEALTGGPKASEELVREKFESLTKEDFLAWCLSLTDESKPYIAHRNAHYFEKLKKMLEKAGFKNIERSSYEGSIDPELRGEAFDMYEEISLYIECYK